MRAFPRVFLPFSRKIDFLYPFLPFKDGKTEDFAFKTLFSVYLSVFLRAFFTFSLIFVMYRRGYKKKIVSLQAKVARKSVVICKKVARKSVAVCKKVARFYVIYITKLLILKQITCIVERLRVFCSNGRKLRTTNHWS